MHESLGSSFFRISIGIQSGSHVFEESRWVIIFSTRLAATRVSKIRVLRNDLRKQLLGELKRRGIKDLPLLRTLLLTRQKPPESF